jgi:hypothetical protein
MIQKKTYVSFHLADDDLIREEQFVNFAPLKDHDLPPGIGPQLLFCYYYVSIVGILMLFNNIQMIIRCQKQLLLMHDMKTMTLIYLKVLVINASLKLL